MYVEGMHIYYILYFKMLCAQRIELQQISHILEQPISLQTSRRKTRKRPYMYSLVLFIPVGAGTVPACTRKKNQKYLHIRVFDAIFLRPLKLKIKK